MMAGKQKTAKTVAEARGEISNLIDSVERKINEYRSQLAALKQERREVEASRVPDEVIAERIDNLIKGATKSGIGHNLCSPNYDLGIIRELTSEHISPFQLLCTLCPEQVRASLNELAIARGIELGTPITNQERKSELARIDDEIAHLERMEADDIWELREAGFNYAFRADACPYAVLGLERKDE